MIFRETIKTRYSETGQDGIIHHSSYVIYFEVARLEFFKSLGFDVTVLERKKIFCPVVDLSVKYIKPLFALEDIVVEIFLNEFSRVVFKLGYRIFKKEILVASGFTSHCFTNEAFKPKRIPEEILSQFKVAKNLQ